LDGLCPHHEVPVKHTLWECRLMKNYVKGILKSKMEDQPRSEPPDNDDGGGGGLHSLEKMAQCT
jgi:hypothetical protein